MADTVRLNRPWLVAVWPGMGHVAVSAGYYLMAKLGMHLLAEFAAEGLFDVDHVEVKGGLIRPGRMPRNRLFARTDPAGRHDLVVFIGEAQPPLGKHAFCRKLVEFAGAVGVERVFTFAAMATGMHPAAPSRVFGAATDEEGLAELRRLELEVVEDGQIGGLNGVLLGAAAEAGLRGACLLGEMPQVFAQLPFPKASLAVLDVFTTVAGIALDTTELAAQAADVEHKLDGLLHQMRHALDDQAEGDDEPDPSAPPPEPADDEGLDPGDEQRIEHLFALAGRDRAHAYELKRLLDRLGAYREYEDRFLDLFKRSK